MAVRNSSGIIQSGLILYIDAASEISYELNEVEVLVVGGGGGGGTGGGGGGAGGLVYQQSYKVTQGNTISVTVGPGGTNTSTWGGSGSRGTNSGFGTITAYGGSGGSHRGSLSGAPFGSGGGDAGGGETIIAGTIGQGKNGGLSRNVASTFEDPGGGGGGAGENGESTASTSGTFGDQTAPRPGIAGKGGNGLYFPQFAPFAGSPAGWFAGGGGGSNRDGYGRPGGLGGGGRGGKSPIAGVTNSGGGGGGTGYSGYGGGGTSAVGGKGIVIVRYPGPQKATGGDIIRSVGGYTTHVFNNDGTFTPLSTASIKSNFYGLQNVTGSGTDLIASGGPTYSSTAGGAVTFDGSNDQLLSDSDVLYELNTTQEFTVEQWILYNNSNPAAGNPFGYGSGSDTPSQYSFVVHAQNNGFYAFISNGSSSGGSTANTGTLTNNTWYHISWTVTPTSIIPYVNGVSATSSSPGFTRIPFLSNFFVAVGRDVRYAQGTAIRHFLGSIAITRVYNRVLSASEVQQNFNAQRRRFGI